MKYIYADVPISKDRYRSAMALIRFLVLVFLGITGAIRAQVAPNINTGNPNFPFPQFLDYKGGGKLETIASSAHHAPGVTHAELELRIREAYRMICNNLTYTISGVGGPVTVSGVRYVQPNYALAIQHCQCVEGDGYNLLAAAYMADKPTFDGYFMWMHDRQFQRSQRYIDCVVNSPGYQYSPGISGAGSMSAGTNVYGGALAGNSATDGDVDLAMALLVAWKQWGDTASIATNPCTGVKITYKEEALKYMSTMVDTVPYTYYNGTTYLPNGNHTSGVIGLDGYLKNGDSWNEITNWATTYKGMTRQVGGGQFLYIDYSAPAYFNAFAKVLQAEGAKPWLIDQYKRGEASCDWLMGQMASRNLIAFAGRMTLNAANVPTFRNYNDGEDFRLGWRTVLNYVWNGNASTSWNPTTHEVVAGGNTFELNLAKNNQKFMNSPQAYGNTPYKLPTLALDICGISTMTTFHGPQGGGPDSATSATYYRLNKAFGPFSTSAVATQDFNLMAKIYRKCEITWDDANFDTQRYLNANPLYFHEFFRYLGMMVVSGNYHNPIDMVPMANMKVYKSVNKTYAYPGDTLTYTISYRNYGKPDAAGVLITDTLPAGLSYLSHVASGAVTFSASGNMLAWNVGTVRGTNVGLPANLALTRDSIVLKVKVEESAFGRLCNSATVTCTNGTGWTSNEYPNHVTETMERNCVDILVNKPISISKTVDKATAIAGDVLTYTIVVKNKPVDFLNGGRPGVHFTLGLQPFAAPASELKMNFRFFHGADEAYINYKNYRVSYYLNEPTVPSWQVAVSNAEGFGTGTPTIGTQTLVPGTGYNHRFFITFPNQLATVTQHLAEYAANTNKVHRGALVPPRMEARVFTNPTGSFNFSDDWSADMPALATTAGSSDLQTLIVNDWTDPLKPNQVIDKYHPEACSTTTKVSSRVLVEEWDGYTWRRIYGNAPVTGREITGIDVRDFLPDEVTFKGWVAGYPVGTVSGKIIKWPTITQLLPKDSVVYKFEVTVNPCSTFVSSNDIVNIAEAKAMNEPAVRDTAITSTACGVTPLSLLYFRGKVQGEQAALSWMVSQKVPFVNYLVYKSADGQHFEKIGSVKSHGGVFYEFVDQHYNGQQSYYKLILQQDNSLQSSKIIHLQTSREGDVVVYPNPFDHEIQVDVSAEEGDEVVLGLVDLAGKELFHYKLRGHGILRLGKDLSPGIYLLRIYRQGEVEYIKLTKY